MKKIAVVGLGVIGASLGMALNATGKYHVIGIDRDDETLQIALETRAAAEVTGDVCKGVRDADVVFLAVPVTGILRIAEIIEDCVPPGAVVTDVGSTKRTVVEALEERFSSRFVGGHPMTGSEYTGIKGADQYLFENAIYVLTPTSRTDFDALETVKTVVADTGARILCVSPHEHDLMVAAVSHLPHLLAVSLMNTACEIARVHPETLILAAGGFRDITRIASSQSSMWRDIYATNRKNIIEVSRELRKYLERIERSLEQEDFDAIVTEIQRARQEREKIPLKIRGFLPSIHEVMVTVPDQPGSIADVTGAIATAGINIIDIEIVRIREGEGGTLRLAFKTSEEADSAQAVLRARGFLAKRR
ncbi:MAG TPA: prephenate dehydrogenase [Syntrophomonadaceae bacterium]|nr:prephenate dehydrogenase [Syntrophomonadaceae bacterium]